MKKNKYKIIVFFLLLTVTLLWGWTVVRTNQKVPQVRMDVQEGGKWIEWQDDIFINVRQKYFMSDPEIRNSGKIEEKHLYADEMKLMWVTIDIQNRGKEEAKINLLNFAAEAPGWYNIPDAEFFYALQEKEQELNFLLKPQEETTCMLPYLLLKTNFREKEWENAEEKDYYITWKLYPEKKTVKIPNSTP